VTSRRGFTMIEIVVLLFLLAAAALVAVPSIGRSTEGLRVRAEVAGFSAFLRRAREQAITRREVRVVTVNAADRVVIDETPEHEVRARRRLPERMTIEADTAPLGGVRFSPEGLSSGGTFRLGLTGGVAYRVTVNRVTGRVTSQREIAP
jgi:type II secretory pathway pseudopilin PulG